MTWVTDLVCNGFSLAQRNLLSAKILTKILQKPVYQDLTQSDKTGFRAISFHSYDAKFAALSAHLCRTPSHSPFLSAPLPSPTHPITHHHTSSLLIMSETLSSKGLHHGSHYHLSCTGIFCHKCPTKAPPIFPSGTRLLSFQIASASSSFGDIHIFQQILREVPPVPLQRNSWDSQLRPPVGCGPSYAAACFWIRVRVGHHQ